MPLSPMYPPQPEQPQREIRPESHRASYFVFIACAWFTISAVNIFAKHRIMIGLLSCELAMLHCVTAATTKASSRNRIRILAAVALTVAGGATVWLTH